MKHEAEVKLLEEMLARDEAAQEALLSDREREAFTDMLGLNHGLTELQRKWILTSAKRLGIVVDESSNPFSSMPPDEQREHKRRAAGISLPWEKPEYKKPMKPPGVAR